VPLYNRYGRRARSTRLICLKIAELGRSEAQFFYFMDT
jgi:hypothetical protein